MPQVAWWTFFALLTSAGAVLRFHGIGEWPLADDEFYSTTAVLQILEHGLPIFDCGGIYGRSFLFHYLGVPFVWLDPGTKEAGLRVLSTLTNLAAVPAVYLLGRTLYSRGIAIVAVLLFLFSLWEIEFARFGRMYAFFQTLTLWQAVCLWRHADTRDVRYFVCAAAIAILGVLSWEGGLFLVAALALPWWLNARLPHYRHVAIVLSIAVVGGWLLAHDFRGVTALPDSIPAGSGSLLINPLTDRLDALVPVVIASLAVAFCWAFFWRREDIRIGDIGWTSRIALLATFATASLGLILAALIAAFLLSQSNALRRATDARAARASAAAILLATAAWGIYCLAHGMGAFGTLTFLFDYPDIWRRQLVLWFDVMPVWTTILVGATAATALMAMRPSSSTPALRYLMALTVLLTALACTIDTRYAETRYTFFVYPLFLLIALYPLSRLTVRLPHAGMRAAAIGLAACALFIVSEDHDLTRLIKLNTYNHAFRVGMSGPMSRHLYPRWDYASAATFLRQNRRSDDALIVTSSTHAFYLNDITAVYQPRTTGEYRSIVCSDLSTERWSNAPLVASRNELRKTLSRLRADRSVWLVTHTPQRATGPWESELTDTFSSSIRYQTPDASFNVYELKMDSPLSTTGDDEEAEEAKKQHRRHHEGQLPEVPSNHLESERTHAEEKPVNPSMGMGTTLSQPMPVPGGNA